jgi:hypothetical protein
MNALPCPADVLMYVVATGEQWNSHIESIYW